MTDIDLSITPWDRLRKLAPPNTKDDDLQAAAQRYSTWTDVYAAAADLWEDAAMCIDLSPDAVPAEGVATGAVKSVSQDGISVEYATDALIGGGLSSRIAQHGQMMAKVRQLRARAKPRSPLMHRTDYNPWRGVGVDCPDDEAIIEIEE